MQNKLDRLKTNCRKNNAHFILDPDWSDRKRLQTHSPISENFNKMNGYGCPGLTDSKTETLKSGLECSTLVETSEPFCPDSESTEMQVSNH